MEQITLQEYMDIKQEIRTSMMKSVISFVEIGYNLKRIRDKELYRQDGYKDIWEAAEAEFGLKRKQAWAFININDRYSVDGNSMELLPQYQDFSKSTLTEMLTLPEEDYELITKNTKIEEIRELRRAEQEYKNEEQLEGQQSLLDNYNDVVPEQDKPDEADLSYALRELFHPKDMERYLNRLLAGEDIKIWASDFYQNVNHTFSKMPYFIFFYEYNSGFKIKNVKTQSIESHAYSDFWLLVSKAFMNEIAQQEKSGKEVWDIAFGEEYREQQRIEKEKENTKKEAKKKNNENGGALMKNAASGDLECSKSEEKEVQQVEESVTASETTQNDTTETPKNVDFIQGEATLEEPETEETEVVAGEVEEEEKTVCDIAQDTDPETGDLIGYTITLPVVPGESIYEIVPYSGDGDGNITYTVVPRTVYMYEIKNGNVVMRYHTDYASGEVTFKPDKTDAWSKLEENKMFVTEEQARQRMEQLNGKE